MTVYGPGSPKYGREGRPLRAKPRSKGNRAELAVIDILKRHGWTRARRNWMSGGKGGGDILEGPKDYHLEVKHRERAAIFEWIAQAEAEARPTDTPAVIFRRNRSPWYAAIPLDALLELLRGGEDADPGSTAAHPGPRAGEPEETGPDEAEAGGR